ncbi:phage portal protein [Enterococcus faecalis]|uniref:phage portal protein n=1 Tax=Enterococcus faecalis TaxID=1351 RepID=UPI00032E71F5|nr:phage portal protein [Enterococcus faecalis]EGO5060475.1 phage portal protein [Enterococcus faecalis]ELS0476244.1 phage portal protein [Enterococcus faecalis]EOI15575.1 SPP1 family phage portal protein [Enterococcus faecalis EnGen0244]UKV07996.1 phage portal protein [Enterococcus faecalis]HCU0729906.1 phage portal protein [Enterococcus faecalis]
MEIEAVKKIIKQQARGYSSKIAKIRKSELYYENKNDILRKRNVADRSKEKDSTDNPLRNADNRVSMPWHQLLVDQKAAYTMTVPPTFDLGKEEESKETNRKIVAILGDHYPKVAKDLCINASNAGIAWLHVWKDADHKNFFRYAVVDSKQIIPVYSKRLTNKLEGLLRVYEDYDEQGETIIIYEYWNEKECSVFKKKKKDDYDSISEHNIYNLYDVGTGEVIDSTNIYEHDWDKVPFIPFRNNPSETSDLQKYKKLVDVYDKVYSGFVNDLDDIQEIIFVLTNYGGQDKQEFLDDLKKYKMVKVDDDGDGEKSGVDTLAIEIPVEARTKILETTRELIFLHGQGVDPQKNIGQNNSGSALEYMYSLLELKASMLETEFSLGFAELVRFILKYLEHNEDDKIEQKWTRTSIKDDAKMAEIISKLAPNTSKEAIAKNNPLVEDWEEEVANLSNELTDDYRAEDDYRTKDVNEDE